MSMLAFDTNILVYAVDQLAPSERREKAQALLGEVANEPLIDAILIP